MEYALIVSAFVGVSLGAVSTLNGGAQTYFEDSSERVGKPINSFAVDQDGVRPGGGQIGTTTSVTAATSTTPSTTTTAPVTTTTIKPTTTTSTTSTTTTTIKPTTTTSTTTSTTVPNSISLTLSDGSYWYQNNRWAAIVTFKLTGTGNTSVNNIKISSSWETSGGSQASGSCWTNSSGECTLSWSSRRSYDYWVDVDVTNVDSNLWTGSNDYIRVYQP